MKKTFFFLPFPGFSAMINLHFGETHFCDILLRNLSPHIGDSRLFQPGYQELRKYGLEYCFLCSNGALFDGQGRITPDMLTWLPESGVLKMKGRKGKEIRLELVRDAIFLAAGLEDRKEKNGSLNTCRTIS